MAKGIKQMESDYARAAKALAFLRSRSRQQPTLGQAAAAVDLSPHHFQRLFKRWVGISPKKYLQSLTLTDAQQQLRSGRSVLDSALTSGLSGPGRLHDLFVTFQSMTPAEYRDHGAGLEIGYGMHDSPFGRCLLGITARGICWLSFPESETTRALAPLRDTWPGAELSPAQNDTAGMMRRIFPGEGSQPNSLLPLLVQGTDFQLQVWRALLGIPLGATATYGELAETVQKPRAARAVGTAVGRNAIAFLIPCHRIIRSDGGVGGYRWGSPRKDVMLEWERIRLLDQ
jgi:AraC family transcriptional regulator of adaptative response/methylated-DNA-[protein]-cysteine methyltransferase